MEAAAPVAVRWLAGLDDPLAMGLALAVMFLGFAVVWLMRKIERQGQDILDLTRTTITAIERNTAAQQTTSATLERTNSVVGALKDALQERPRR